MPHCISGRTDIQWSEVAIGSLVFQGVIVCFISFLVWFWLLKEYVASQLGVFSFMTPMFGIVFGVVVLGEKLEQSFISGASTGHGRYHSGQWPEPDKEIPH